MTDQNTKPQIAFIGIGLMGSQMTRRLLNTGYQVSISNRSPEKCVPLAKEGARIANSVADAVKDADIILTCLAGEAAIEAVYFGEQGILSAAKANSLTIDLSSVAPDIAKNNHIRINEAGLQHLDSPVTGGVSGAEAGTLSILVGGTAENLERASTVLNVLGNPFHLGEMGAGQVCKLVNQTIVHVYIGAVSEGMMLAAASGVDAEKVREALMGGYCQSKILEIHGGKMANRDFLPGGPLEFAVKDLQGAMNMASESALNLPLTTSVLHQYKDMVKDGLGRLDHSALVLAYEKSNAPIKVSPEKEEKRPH